MNNNIVIVSELEKENTLFLLKLIEYSTYRVNRPEWIKDLQDFRYESLQEEEGVVFLVNKSQFKDDLELVDFINGSYETNFLFLTDNEQDNPGLLNVGLRNIYGLEWKSLELENTYNKFMASIWMNRISFDGYMQLVEKFKKVKEFRENEKN